MDVRPRTDVKVRPASTKNFFKMWEFNQQYRSTTPVTAYYDEINRRLWVYDKSAKDSKGYGEGYFLKSKDYTESFIDAYNSFMVEKMIYGKTRF